MLNREHENSWLEHAERYQQVRSLKVQSAEPHASVDPGELDERKCACLSARRTEVRSCATVSLHAHFTRKDTPLCARFTAAF